MTRSLIQNLLLWQLSSFAGTQEVVLLVAGEGHTFAQTVAPSLFEDTTINLCTAETVGPPDRQCGQSRAAKASEIVLSGKPISPSVERSTWVWGRSSEGQLGVGSASLGGAETEDAYNQCKQKYKTSELVR